MLKRGTQVLYKKIVELGYALELTSSTDTLDTAQYLQEVGQCARARAHTHTHTHAHTRTLSIFTLTPWAGMCKDLQTL